MPVGPLFARLPEGWLLTSPLTVESGPVRFRVVVVEVAEAMVLAGLPLAPVKETVRLLVVIEALTAVAVLTVWFRLPIPDSVSSSWSIFDEHAH